MKQRIAIVVGLLVACGVAVAAGPQQSKTEYMVMLAGGKKMGYVENVRQVAAGKVTTVQTSVMTISRMGSEVTIRQTETTVETRDGQPLSFAYSQDLGGSVTTTRGTIAGAKAKVEVTSGRQVRKMEVPWPVGAVLGEGMRLLMLQKGFKEGTRYSAQVFAPSMLLALDANVTIGARKQVDLLGRVVDLTEAAVVLTSPSARIESTNYLDDNADSLKLVMPMLGMRMEMVSCTKEYALASADLADIFDHLMVASPSPLGDLAKAESVTYKIVLKQAQTQPAGEAAMARGKLSFPQTPSQTVKDEAGAVTLTVRPVAARGGAFPYKGTNAEAVKALKPTQYLQADADEVRALAVKATAGAKDAAEAAGRVQDFVRKYVTRKDLSVGYATAQEVARSRQGDCSEHAVLAAAMCRAAGLPAQVVVGLAYVEKIGDKKDVFWPHAWFRVLIEGEWVDYDAAMDGFDAGHIALSAGDGDPSDFFSLVNTMGNFRIAEATKR